MPCVVQKTSWVVWLVTFRVVKHLIWNIAWHSSSSQQSLQTNGGGETYHDQADCWAKRSNFYNSQALSNSSHLQILPIISICDLSVQSVELTNPSLSKLTDSPGIDHSSGPQINTPGNFSLSFWAFTSAECYTILDWLCHGIHMYIYCSTSAKMTAQFWFEDFPYLVVFSSQESTEICIDFLQCFPKVRSFLPWCLCQGLPNVECRPS